MKTIAFLLIIAIGIGSFFLAANAAENKKEKKSLGRAVYQYVNLVGLVQFGKMIYCETGKWPLSYNNYGCFCGKGHHGKTGVDATDRCCKAHDQCYENLEKTGVCWKWAWWYTPYLRSGCSGCSWFNIPCGKGLCACDQAAARCFKRALSTYNRRYKNYQKNLCR